VTSDFFAIDGRVMPAADAVLPVLDLGFLRGLGAFETFRTYGGHPHALPAHLDRLWGTAALFGVAPCFTEADLRRVVARILELSGHDEVRVNLVVSPGDHTSGVFGAEKPRWVVIARDLHAPPEAWYERGVTATTFRGERPSVHHKTTNYLCGRTGLQAAEVTGAHEAFYLNAADEVTEGVTSNILARFGTTIRTPITTCLPGITKAGLKPLAEAEGLRWEEGPLPRADLFTADELWITSAVREILPVVAVDGQPIGTGTVGPWAKRLRVVYQADAIASAARDATP
jgi:branched-subunit amino acid aminotransferase/4-amino-4-deoxychorismate lyase